MTSILTSSKNDPYIFCSTLHGLSNAVYRFLMRCIVLELSRGVEITPAAPDLGWHRPPPVRGLIIHPCRHVYAHCPGVHPDFLKGIDKICHIICCRQFKKSVILQNP